MDDVTLHQAKAIIRKAVKRIPEGEAHGELNLTAMMDMMSILLVFMIKSMTASTAGSLPPGLTLPPSTTTLAPPEEAVSLVIAKTAILVEGEASQTSTLRWEDYTTTAIDPSDDCTVWYVGDYLKKGASTYSSRIGAFRMPGCR